MKLAQHMVTTAIILAGFAIAGTGLVAFTYQATKGKIAEAERDALLRSLHSVVKPEEHDNELFSDLTLVASPRLLGTKKPLPAFRARKNGKPVAVILTAIAPDGYNGDIKLLIGVNYNGTLSGVRVLTHRETPGLGDAMETRRSDWILGFDGLSSKKPDKKDWKVKRDGGYFDQFTGATITPRAIVKAVHNALDYYKQHKQDLF